MQEEIKELESTSVRAALDDAFNDLLESSSRSTARVRGSKRSPAPSSSTSTSSTRTATTTTMGAAPRSPNRVEELLRRLRMNIVLDNDGTDADPGRLRELPDLHESARHRRALVRRHARHGRLHPHQSRLACCARTAAS
jgi:hypothetical protein